MSYYQFLEKEPGHIRITSPKPVFMDLFIGSERALLLDTGYGEGPLAQEVKERISVPLVIVNTHAHWDHACGNRQFAEPVYLNEKELPLYDRVEPEHGPVLPLTEGMVFDLGGLTLRAIDCPGHTAGSTVLFWEEEKLLFTGDAMNPTFWLFLPECLQLSDYQQTLRKAMKIPMKAFYISHRENRFLPEALERFLYCAEHLDFENGEPFHGDYGVKDVRYCAPWGKTHEEMEAEGLPYIVISKEHLG